MHVGQVREVGKGIKAYLAEFADCFGRCDTAGTSAAGSDERQSVSGICLTGGSPAVQSASFCQARYSNTKGER